MSQVSREEFDALSTRVTNLEHEGDALTAVPAPTQPPVPPGEATGLSLGVPVVTVVHDHYTISATATANEDLKLTFFQIAVRGPDAGDLALTPKIKVTKGQVLTLGGSATGTGEFSAFLAYSLDGTHWVEGPKATFTAKPDPNAAVITPTPRGNGVPLVGRSGIGFNSIVFRQTPAAADEFGKRRGVPMDGFLTFASRQNWGNFRAGYGGWKEWLEAGRIAVMSMPHAPESEGGAMNSKGANDAYKNEQRELGRYLAGLGLNHPNFTVRVDWECNGNWYHWSANRPGGAPALKLAITNYITNLRAGGLTKATFDLCFNKGPSQAGADFAIFPGAEYVGIIGVDQYDMWSASFNDGDWTRELAKSPTIKTVAEFATKHGIQWSLDEGGNTHGSNAQGGDNPVYWDLVYKTVMKYRENNAWHCTYDHAGAPNTLRHDFASNPRSWEKYKGLFRPR